ncbi:ribosomal protein S5 domain 2-type protein [Blastocladiella britannica]|nr:ribosomal protein S5 domain 2-type protein [Blastocladiella britannica]
MTTLVSTTSNGTLKLSPEAKQRLHPGEYLRQFVDQGARLDFRKLSEFRSPMVTKGSISSANASALVSLGKTVVLCAVKAEVAVPSPDSPDRGFFVPNVDLPPICSTAFRPGPPAAQAQVLSQMIADIHARTPIVDTEALCIEEGQAVWVLYADIVCLSYDGNVLDAALLALAAALKSALLPAVEFDEEQGSVRASSKLTIPVTVLRTPLSTTIAVFNGKMLVDPTEDEEKLVSQSTVAIVDATGAPGSMMGIHTSGQSTADMEQLRTYASIAQERAAELAALI